jgi:hypothetical protein
MNKINLKELPHCKSRIDWNKCIGSKVYFQYEEINDFLTISKYENNFLTIQYKNKSIEIDTGNFKLCKIGKLFNRHLKTPIYHINDIIKTKTGNLKILKIYTRNHRSWYKYQCLNDGYIGNVSGSSIDNGSGCPVCSNPPKVIVNGINDMWTTAPEQAKLLANPEDGYKYSRCSNKRLDWKCPNCGNIIKNNSIHNVYYKGLSCSMCSDGISYPNKLIYNILEQIIPNQHIAEYKINNKRYDEYLINLNCIIEMQGLQHYTQSFKGKSFSTEQQNDKLKQEIALKNGIQNYIIIDAKYSDLEYIKNNIINSQLSNLLDLSKINWDKADKKSQTSLVKKSCELWNKGIHSTIDIGKQLNIHHTIISNYLKRGTKLNWCNYDAKYARNHKYNYTNNKIKNKIGISVICTTTNKVFQSISDASKFYHTYGKGISLCCQHKKEFSGKFNNILLKWEYDNS